MSVGGLCKWCCAGTNQRVCGGEEALGGGADLWLADELSAIGQRLRIIARNIGDIDLPCPDPDYNEATGIKFDLSELFKHPLIYVC